MTQNLTDAVRNLILEVLQARENNPQFRDDESLVISGRFDSLIVIELATKLEKSFHVDFNKIGFDQYELDSVRSIVLMLEKFITPLS